MKQFIVHFKNPSERKKTTKTKAL